MSSAGRNPACRRGKVFSFDSKSSGSCRTLAIAPASRPAGSSFERREYEDLLHRADCPCRPCRAGYRGQGTGRIPYVDDRSDGAALVRSLYNAINRKEYARAYGYFGASRPVGEFKAFADGYAKTVSVEAKFGKVLTEGAAGSIYSAVPVAIKSIEEGGKARFFSGCYVTRIINPSLQVPPFTPYQIETARLDEAEGPIEEAIPATCNVP